MTIYDITIPEFTAVDRAEFTASINSVLFIFLAEWWDDLWHMAIDKEGEKRTCTVYPNTIHFPGDKTYRLAIISDLPTIGYTDLSGILLQVAVSD